MKNLFLFLPTCIIVFSCNQVSNSGQSKNDTSQIKEKLSKDSLIRKATIGFSYKDIQVSTIKLGESSKDLDRLGHIDSTITETSDFDQSNFKKYYLKKSYFEVDTNNKICGFSIVDSSLIFKTFDIKVGENKDVVIDRLKSYLNQQDDMSNIKDNILRIRIDNSDDYIMFTFKNGILYKYETWSDE